jgi:hypothetical protein
VGGGYHDVPTWAGFLYLAVVLDAFSRRIVGWSKPDGTPRKLLDVSKITALGLRYRTDLETGIRQTYGWYLKTKAERLPAARGSSTNRQDRRCDPAIVMSSPVPMLTCSSPDQVRIRKTAASARSSTCRNSRRVVGRRSRSGGDGSKMNRPSKPMICAISWASSVSERIA